MTFLVISRLPPATKLVVADGKISFKSPYSEPVFLDAFKAVVPFSDRRWDRDATTWIVSESYLDQMSEIVEDAFGSKPEVVRC